VPGPLSHLEKHIDRRGNMEPEIPFVNAGSRSSASVSSPISNCFGLDILVSKIRGLGVIAGGPHRTVFLRARSGLAFAG
jgi:hypothetical protein